MKKNCKFIPHNEVILDVPYIKRIICVNGHEYKPQYAHIGEIEKNKCPKCGSGKIKKKEGSIKLDFHKRPLICRMHAA